MQCKDIPGEPILCYLADRAGTPCSAFSPTAAPSAIGRTVREAMPPEAPDKLVLAKMRQLIRRGLVSGCACGCRGDFEITERGRECLGR